MPATATAAVANGPEQLIARLSSSGDSSCLLLALREIKNQIIGNRTKKLLYLRLQAVPRIVALLSSPAGLSPAVIVQAAAAVGSFACGVEEGVRAVIDAGAVWSLTNLLSHPDGKVVDATARSLRIIFQSKMAPKYDFIPEKNMQFILSLLNTPNENITELAASIISHSCKTPLDQISLSNSGVLQKLISLLTGSINQRDASLDAMSAIIKNNFEVASRFVSIGNGKAFNSLIGLINDRNPKTRLLASACIIIVERLDLNPVYFKEGMIKNKLILILLELIEEVGKVGDEAPFVLRDLILESEEIQREVLNLNVLERLCGFLNKGKGQFGNKKIEGILLVLSELGSCLEQGRSQLIQLQVPNLIIDMLKHDSLQVRVATCFCIKNISRSLKNLCAGQFSSDSVITPLVQLLCDSSTFVQIAALGAICNMAVNLTSKKSVLLKYEAVPMLTQLTKSNNSEVRLKSLCALRNLMFLLDRKDKDLVFSQLGLSSLTSFISDSDHLVQEQALALASNFIDGFGDSTKLILSDDNCILNAVSKLLQISSSPRVCTQGMLFLTNIAAGVYSHKDAVMNCILPTNNKENQNIIIGFLQSKDRLLRLGTLWCLVNLVYPKYQNSYRVQVLQNYGVISQLNIMKDVDPCLDCKLRINMVLEQCHEK